MVASLLNALLKGAFEGSPEEAVSGSDKFSNKKFDARADSCPLHFDVIRLITREIGGLQVSDNRGPAGFGLVEVVIRAKL